LAATRKSKIKGHRERANRRAFTSIRANACEFCFARRCAVAPLGLKVLGVLVCLIKRTTDDDEGAGYRGDRDFDVYWMRLARPLCQRSLKFFRGVPQVQQFGLGTVCLV
jgi:hypothetical protein